jgi:hypothetical protein
LCDVCRGRPERPSSFWEPIAQPERKKKKRRRGSRRRRGKRSAGKIEAPTTPLVDAMESGEAILPIDEVSIPADE